WMDSECSVADRRTLMRRHGHTGNFQKGGRVTSVSPAPVEDHAPLFSVVIPVYNGEDFVAEAIQSVLDQTIDPHEVEVVVVDDGSEDSTGSILDEYAAQDGRVVALHQPNGGVSVALNSGVDAARGKYVGFLG